MVAVENSLLTTDDAKAINDFLGAAVAASSICLAAKVSIMTLYPV